MNLTLHGAALSPFVRKVRIVLEEKGLSYHHQIVLPYRLPAGYEQLNPLRRIPALEDGDFRIADSAVICHYLEQKHPEHPLLPNNPQQRARVEWFEKYADYELAPVATFTLFDQAVLKRLQHQAPDQLLIQRALTEQLPPLLDYLEAELGHQLWFVGNRFTLADIAVFSQLVSMHHAGYPLDPDHWPHLAALYQRISERRYVANMLELEAETIEKIRQKPLQQIRGA